MATNTITVKTELNIEDAIAWNNYYLEHSAQWKKNWKLIRMVFMPVMVICFILGIIYLNIGINKDILSTFVAGGIGIIIGAGGFLYFANYPKILKRRIRKNAYQTYIYKNNFVGTHKFSVSPEGIRDNAEDPVKWAAVEDIVRTETHVFILVQGKKAVIIPAKAFADDAAVTQFIQGAKAIFKFAQTTA